MSIHVETVEIYFTPRELRWLEERAAEKNDTVLGFVRNRALNTDSIIPGEESYKKFGSDWQCTCGVCCLD